MIIKNRKEVRIVYKGDKVCFCSFKGENLIYGVRNLFTAETYRILMTNFPTKIDKIVGYVNRHPKIVPFINEDPMLVCSLGIEGMPIRWLKANSNAYIDLNYIHKTTTKANITYMVVTPSTWKSLFGARNGSYVNNAYILWYGGGSKRHVYNRTGQEKVGVVDTEANVVYRAITGGLVATIYKNGILSETITCTSTNNAGLCTWFLFACNKANSASGKNLECPGNNYIADFEILEGDTSIIHLIPFKDNKMIDINAIGTERRLYYENTGSGYFSIAYTFSDGTPWQPIT